jgi:hypothetical protein
VHDDLVNNSRLTAPIDGVYQISGDITFVSSVTGEQLAGEFSILVRVTNAANPAGVVVAIHNFQVPPATVAAQPVRIAVSTLYDLEVNADAELLAFHSQGNVNVVSLPQFTPEFMMGRIGEIPT